MSQPTMCFTPFARNTEMPTRPSPPQPSTATRSCAASGGSFAAALYAVRPEQASVAAKASSIPAASTRYLGSGTRTWVEYAPGRLTPRKRMPETQ
jgi:hypothetical protein